MKKLTILSILAASLLLLPALASAASRDKGDEIRKPGQSHKSPG